MSIKFPFTRRFLIWLDDALKYGVRNPTKKWWLDLEVINNKIVKPAGANKRDLTLNRDTACRNDMIAVYPVEKLPTADQKAAVRVDRRQGLEDCQQAMRQLQELKQELATTPDG
ncbi:MAG: hypothetical protein ACE5IP_03660 [Terriglobia bacterium]